MRGLTYVACDKVTELLHTG